MAAGILSSSLSISPIASRNGNWSSFMDFALRCSVGERSNDTPISFFLLRLAIPDFGLWTLDFGLWTLDFGLWTLDFGLCPSPKRRANSAAPQTLSLLRGVTIEL